ncbi:lysophospholipid acyltransferase family protein [Brevibacillus daliensis]|uniref:lysophospholipid acyltransferase family protein n=1 Tax=Brevibacillus daliensis TaxID=2892995 RepID=UPI001E3CBC67|nr:lysophospholipid acyltransferase family protein [Brevibacillus daliensis]
MRTLQYYTYMFLYIISKMPIIKRLSKLEGEEAVRNRIKTYYELGTISLQRLMKIAGAEIKVNGAENVPLNEAVLFVSNHQSNMDIPVLFLSSPNKMSFIAKKEMENIPGLGKFMKMGNCLFMDRDNPRQSIKTISEGVDLLKKGYSLSVFPEGTRSKSNQPGEFKPGSLRLATKSGAKIVPVSLKDTRKLMEDNGNRIKPAQVEITFHEPIDPSQYQDTNELNRVVVEKITSVLL